MDQGTKKGSHMSALIEVTLHSAHTPRSGSNARNVACFSLLHILLYYEGLEQRERECLQVSEPCALPKGK